MITADSNERIRAILNWLLDEGHITPMGVRQLERILAEDMEKV